MAIVPATPNEEHPRDAEEYPLLQHLAELLPAGLERRCATCYAVCVLLNVELEREEDGRWIAAIDPIGALAYGRTRAEAIRKAKALALEVIADRLARGESPLTGRRTRRAVAFPGVRFVA